MANICSVNHIFMMSDDKDGLEQMDNFQKLLEKYSNMPDPKEFSKLHLMARELGISEEELEGCNTRSFDISVCDIQNTEYRSHMNGDTLWRTPIYVEESTAWDPCTEAWELIMSKFPLIHHYWISFEYGNLSFSKCDMVGEDSFLPNYVVYCGRAEDSPYEFFYTMEEVNEYLSEYLTEEEMADIDSVEDVGIYGI